MKLFYAAVFHVALLWASTGLSAQPCFIEQSFIDGTAGITMETGVGQSFLACGDGVITAIQVSFSVMNAEQLDFVLFNLTDQADTYNQIVRTGIDATGSYTVLLETPFAVIDGEEYAFAFTAITEGMGATIEGTFNENSYLDGDLITIVDGEVTAIESELSFSISFVPDACAISQKEENTTFFLTEEGIGQTFTACTTGALTQITTNFEQINHESLLLEISTADAVMAPVYAQTYANPKLGENNVTLDVPFLLEEGVQYSFLWKTTDAGTGQTRVRLNNVDVYAGGTAIEVFNGNPIFPENFDLAFVLTTVEPVCLINQSEDNSFFNSSSAISVGQSFTPCANGQVSHLRFTTLEENGLTEIRVDLNAGANTITADQSFTTTISGTPGDHLIPLPQAFNVLAGEVYSFSITGVGAAVDNIAASNTLPYLGGQAFRIVGGIPEPFAADLDFSVLTFENENVVSVTEIADSRASLKDAFPNPASGSFTIDYVLDESRDVLIELFDVNGRQMRSITVGRQAAGAYRQPMDVSGLPAGIYTYSLRTQNGRSTKRIVLQ